MAFQATTGLGVAAKIVVQGNELPLSSKVGYNNVTLSLTGSNGYPTTFQMNPNIEDVAGNEIAPGTAFSLTSVAASTPGVLTLTAAALATGGTTVYTGTITGGGTNNFVGYDFTVAGFDLAANNGTFTCVANTTTTLTLSNANGVLDTHAATAQANQGVAVYTGTITGGGTNLFAGFTFVVAGFDLANNNGTFICTANTTTTLTLENAFATADTHAATATSQEITGAATLVYYVNPAKTYTTGTYGKLPQGSTVAVASVSSTGLITALGAGGTVVEVNYPTFNNTVGTYSSGSSILNGTYLNKVYGEVNLTVVA